MRIAIIGAGIGGLAAACGLQRQGADVVVLERASQPPASGSALSVFANGWNALDSLGVGDRLREVAGSQVQDLRAGQRTPDGDWLATTSADAIRELRVVHRADLQSHLLQTLAPDTVRFGTTVTSVHPDVLAPAGDTARHASRTGLPSNAGLSVEVDGQDVAGSFDLVVAADGIRSRIRASWGNDAGTRYSGYSAWRAVTSTPVDLLGAAGETWGAGRRFGYAPLRDGRVYWFAVATMSEDAVFADEYGAVVEMTRGWHDPISAILAATDPTTVFRLPVSDLAKPLPSFRRGRCVLVGDAAHAMTPDLGQGGNQAMEDAATLSALLGPLCPVAAPGAAQVDAALVVYDQMRRSRTQPIARRARTVGRVAQARGRFTVPLRNALMRATPEKSLDRQALTIQNWQPPTRADAHRRQGP
jgi:2-polyprenyl-6-methoxyphenol hydroxylase-like FAD-dependent oxidoreductase